METKAEPNRPNACYAKALPDEPMFILLGRDPDAPATIEFWARKREHRPNDDADQIDDARLDATAFQNWRIANDGKWRGAQPTPIEHPSELATSLAGKVLAMKRQPEGAGEAYELFDLAKSLAGAVLRLDPTAGQSGGD